MNRPGISEGNRDKIFRRFFSIRPEGTPVGTGRGLSIVTAVAQAHRGTVELLESMPGQGAAFRITMPPDGPAAIRLPHAGR